MRYSSKHFITKASSHIIAAVILSSTIAILGLNRSPVFAADCSLGTISVTQASFHEVVIDEPALDSTYVSYKIDTGATDSSNDLWVKIENFSDVTKLSLATNEDGLYHVGPMSSSTSEYVYFYLNASATTTAQTYDLNLYDGHPSFGTSNYTHTASHEKISQNLALNSSIATARIFTGQAFLPRPVF